MASTDGCDSSDTRASSALLDSWPSNRIRNPPLVRFTVTLFHSLRVAPGFIWLRQRIANGARQMPKLIGMGLLWAPVMVVGCSLLSVNSVDSARLNRLRGGAELQHHIHAGSPPTCTKRSYVPAC